MRAFLILAMAFMLQQASFKETQQKNSRVKTAYQEKEAIVKKYFSDQKFSFEKFQLFIRAFKKEQILEVWIKEFGKDQFSLLHTYDFCSSSGVLGPKRKEGDLQIPEGVYHINHFNPVSNFYLSLGVNYPNESDKILSDKRKPGGLIYIHGNCVTVGCIPITDEKIKELYVLAVEAKNNGQTKIPVHIFPAKLDAGAVTKLIKTEKADALTSAFWKNLEPVYLDFQQSKRLKIIRVNAKGEYCLNNE
jgi:murein L,D-transpeptidase YafK